MIGNCVRMFDEVVRMVADCVRMIEFSVRMMKKTVRMTRFSLLILLPLSWNSSKLPNFSTKHQTFSCKPF